MEIKQRSAPQRQLWAQFDALQMGSGWGFPARMAAAKLLKLGSSGKLYMASG